MIDKIVDFLVKRCNKNCNKCLYKKVQKLLHIRFNKEK
jgi:hypothetical protein